MKPIKKSLQMEITPTRTSYKADVGGSMVTADRGWLSVDAKYKKNKKSKPTKFRFVNTHLEAFGDPTIKEAQAKELTQKGGPLKTKMRAILVGDLNSALGVPHEVGTGFNSGNDGDQLAFKALAAFGMKDYGTGGDFTCCYGSALDDQRGSVRSHDRSRPRQQEGEGEAPQGIRDGQRSG